jgi:hypothetical protein
MAHESSIWLSIAIMARTHAIPMSGREEAELSTACDKVSTFLLTHAGLGQDPHLCEDGHVILVA